MTDRPTVAERIDPTSPHYDAKFAELRKTAFAAYADHQHDMQTKPEYRKAAKSLTKNRR